MIHAQMININDNVPFLRVYKTKAKFISAFKRMKGAKLDHAIDYNTMEIIRYNDFNRLSQ